jgi:ceramide glucosyltransferase
LRRATFQIFYAPEILTGSLLPILAGVAAAPSFDVDPLSVFFALGAIWFGTEALLAWVARWHLSFLSPLSWVLRDVLLPVLWLEGWAGDTFVWRGNDMSVAKNDEAFNRAPSSGRTLAMTSDVN